jgi:hypothetical protein
MLLELERAERGEDREHGHHHDGRAGDRTGRGLDRVRDRFARRHALVVSLLDPAEDEHVLVHRQSEQDHEQEQRQPRRDRTERAVEKHVSNIFWKLDLPATGKDLRRVLAVLAWLQAGD